MSMLRRERKDLFAIAINDVSLEFEPRDPKILQRGGLKKRRWKEVLAAEQDPIVVLDDGTRLDLVQEEVLRPNDSTPLYNFRFHHESMSRALFVELENASGHLVVIVSDPIRFGRTGIPLTAEAWKGVAPGVTLFASPKDFASSIALAPSDAVFAGIIASSPHVFGEKCQFTTCCQEAEKRETTLYVCCMTFYKGDQVTGQMARMGPVADLPGLRWLVRHQPLPNCTVKTLTLRCPLENGIVTNVWKVIAKLEKERAEPYSTPMEYYQLCADVFISTRGNSRQFTLGQGPFGKDGERAVATRPCGHDVTWNELRDAPSMKHLRRCRMCQSVSSLGSYSLKKDAFDFSPNAPRSLWVSTVGPYMGSVAHYLRSKALDVRHITIVSEHPPIELYAQFGNNFYQKYSVDIMSFYDASQKTDWTSVGVVFFTSPPRWPDHFNCILCNLPRTTTALSILSRTLGFERMVWATCGELGVN